MCSGIEAATVAWHPLGWVPAAFSEIEPFPRAVLAHHYSAVPIHGDFTTIQGEEYGPVELLVGGTPCQSFSMAGLRAGLSDPRGNLMLEYGALAQRLGARWLVWENVAGVLSSNGGRDFGTFLGMLAELGYGFAYRVLDAQYFGVAQRRRRVFVVGYLGNWRAACAVLFERHSLQRHPAPRRALRRAERWAPAAVVESRITLRRSKRVPAGCQQQAFRMAAFGEYEPDEVASTIKARDYKDATDLIVDAAPPIAFSSAFGAKDAGPVSPTLLTDGSAAIAFDAEFARMRGDHQCPAYTVRRLTPRECERLQGFPDDYTAITYRSKPVSDGPRYKALGNSMAVPCMRWIGRRIAHVQQLLATE